MPEASLLPLEARGLVYEADRVRLLQIDELTIQSGGPTIILGPNGAGKSLLLRLLHGLIEPTSGQITNGGMAFGPAIQKRQAMVFQKPVLLRRSVAGNVAYVLKVHGDPGAGRAVRVLGLLASGGLDAKASQPARTLSGGEQQRLALIRAMATKPDILFLDEPTSSLDPGATEAIEALILAASAAGTKVIMVTHNLGQAQRLASDVVFCHQGRITEHTPAEQFFDRPSSDAAAAFVSGKLVL